MAKILKYNNNQLFFDGVSLTAVARQVGTPVYVYSQSTITHQVALFQNAAAAGTLICYAIKANGNPVLLQLLADLGLGADVTSGGELFLAQHAGFSPDKILFSGVGKRRQEIDMALKAGIHSLHVESEMELSVVADAAAARGVKAPISIRVNPNISTETHPYISTGLHTHKFGVDKETAVRLYHLAHKHPWLNPVGAAAHIGSQITDIQPFVDSVAFLVDLADELKQEGVHLDYIDAGGGLGISNKDGLDKKLDPSPSPLTWVKAVSKPVLQAGYQLVVEPGRSIIGDSGVLLTQVVYTKYQKGKRFLIVDAGMNDLIRPTLYKAEHPILPVITDDASPLALADIVGPVCETGDFLAKDRPFPLVRPGDLVAVTQAGAYGFAMSSNYNGRLRPAEALVHKGDIRLIRRRQSYAHLLDGCE